MRISELRVPKELYKGMPNSDIRKLCIALCVRNVNKPSAPTEVEGKGLKFCCDYSSGVNKGVYWGYLPPPPDSRG